MTNLQILSLSGNLLSGEPPWEIGSLGRLETLDLSDNQIRGTIPSSLGNLVQIKQINFKNNQLEGQLPPSLGNLSSLERLDLNTNQISGNIPPECGKLTSLVTLNLGNNPLFGDIPPQLGNLSNLVTLDLSHGQLVRRVPAEFGKLTQLKALYLNANQLSGPLPQALTALSLSTFWFTDNNLCEPNSLDFQSWLSNIPNVRRNHVACLAISDVKQYGTYSADHGTDLPGTLIRADNQPAVNDQDVDGAHGFVQATAQYYLKTFRRNSFDNQGAIIVSTVHYGTNYQMRFGMDNRWPLGITSRSKMSSPTN